MKSNMNTNIKKIASLTLAVLSLAVLVSLLPEHSRAYTASNVETAGPQLIAQK